MDRERLRQMTLDALDDALSHPFWVRLDSEQKRMIHAWQALVQTDDAVLDKVLSLVQRRGGDGGRRMRSRPADADFRLGCLAAALSALFLLALGAYLAFAAAVTLACTREETATVLRVYERERSHYVEVSAGPGAEVFQNDPVALRGKFASSELQASLRPGRRYRFKTCGVRSPLLGLYRNVLEAKEDCDAE